MDDALNISYDRFIRTTEPAHHRASQAIWQAMADQGDLYLGRYEGWYSVRDEAYYGEEELVVADSGEKLSPQGTEVEWTVEESWFFRLSAYQDRLLAHYAANPDFIRPESRRNEVLRFVEGGLTDLSISRTSFDWGVKVPGSPDHVMYVWLDALTNYLTGVGYPEDTEAYRKFWPADLHIIGKDVVRFHAVYWPAFLMSAGIPLPKQVFGHGWLLLARREDVQVGRQCRRSDRPGPRLRRRPAALFPAARGHLRPGRRLQRRGDRHQGQRRSRQQLRQSRPAHAVLHRQELRRRAAAGREGRSGRRGAARSGPRRRSASELPAQFEALALSQGIEAWLQAVFACNQYIDAQAPWALRKTDPERMDAVLATLYEAIADLAIAIQPVIPAAAAKLLDAMGVPAGERDYAALADEGRYARLAASGFTLRAAEPDLPAARSCRRRPDASALASCCLRLPRACASGCIRLAARSERRRRSTLDGRLERPRLSAARPITRACAAATAPERDLHPGPRRGRSASTTAAYFADANAALQPRPCSSDQRYARWPRPRAGIGRRRQDRRRGCAAADTAPTDAPLVG